ncbi:Na+/H+ antiporter subunit C [Arachnia propionica]|uniref:Na+/H+ antiporter subunit C n=1 Tax=Arachnia propionica TaxID=1750 RepID=A0A3P1TCL2_9ACTN|nr:cation:proton antiporter subunit C [Arachnia propionica]MDO5081998.1 cation:proton antiporter subunit C [Arachnia propionica]RRD07159.1 Na+/H+ antiporter subunit C [Arachnia propionica]
MILIATIFVLVTGGVYLLLQRSMVRAVFGLSLLSHAANFTLLVTGVPGWRAEPITDGTDIASFADPLPQAFVLTAIVITLAVTILMLAMAVIGRDDMLTRHPETGESRQA